jgi:hypothetical protein
MGEESCILIYVEILPSCIGHKYPKSDSLTHITKEELIQKKRSGTLGAT